MIGLGSHQGGGAGGGGGGFNFNIRGTPPSGVGTDLNTLASPGSRRWSTGPELLSRLLRHAQRAVGQTLTPYPQRGWGEGEERGVERGGGGKRGGAKGRNLLTREKEGGEESD